MTICQLCHKPIEGSKASKYKVCGQSIILGQTVHDECYEQFEAEQAKRKPYRQPLEDPFATRNRTGITAQELTETVRDFD